jgi:hypothetical protein
LLRTLHHLPSLTLSKLRRARSRLHGRSCARLTQRSGKLRLLQLSAQRAFVSSLRPFGRAFEPRLTHSRSGTTLLLQNVSAQFLLGYCLTGSAIGIRPYSLRSNRLLLNLSSTSNVRQRLLNSRVFILVHKLRYLIRRKSIRRTR